MSKTQKHIKMLQNFENLNSADRLELVRYFKSANYNLLTPDFANAKTAKNQGHKVLSMILHLAPSTLSGFNMCPAASKGCASACLNTAGRGRFDSIQESRIRKTLFFIKLKDAFLQKLSNEIYKLEKRAAKQGLKPVVRLNGTSDIPWENIKIGNVLNIFELFPNVQFYDYTKVFSRLARLKAMDLKNYHVVFSASESNWEDCLKALALGYNVATVFNAIPETYQGFDVIDGDAHDLRFMDLKRGAIVGLKAKGDAKKDKSGFVKFINQPACKNAA